MRLVSLFVSYFCGWSAYWPATADLGRIGRHRTLAHSVAVASWKNIQMASIWFLTKELRRLEYWNCSASCPANLEERGVGGMFYIVMEASKVEGGRAVLAEAAQLS
jgi:hypothetical protein